MSLGFLKSKPILSSTKAVAVWQPSSERVSGHTLFVTELLSSQVKRGSGGSLASQGLPLPGAVRAPSAQGLLGEGWPARPSSNQHALILTLQTRHASRKSMSWASLVVTPAHNETSSLNCASQTLSAITSTFTPKTYSQTVSNICLKQPWKFWS